MAYFNLNCDLAYFNPNTIMQTPKDRLRILDAVVMTFTMIGVSIMAYKMVVTVIALYMIATLNIRKDIL